MKPNFGDRIVEKKKRERTNRIKRIFLYIFMLSVVTGMVTMAYFFGKKHAEVKQTVSDSIDTEQEKAIYKEEKGADYSASFSLPFSFSSSLKLSNFK